MSENAKKGILAVLIVGAVIAAGFGASTFFRGEQPEVVQTIQGSGKSEKDAALEQQAAAGKEAGERDLGGAPE